VVGRTEFGQGYIGLLDAKVYVRGRGKNQEL
jgi:hypothetical protein